TGPVAADVDAGIAREGAAAVRVRAARHALVEAGAVGAGVGVGIAGEDVAAVGALRAAPAAARAGHDDVRVDGRRRRVRRHIASQTEQDQRQPGRTPHRYFFPPKAEIRPGITVWAA